MTQLARYVMISSTSSLPVLSVRVWATCVRLAGQLVTGGLLTTYYCSYCSDRSDFTSFKGAGGRFHK